MHNSLLAIIRLRLFIYHTQSYEEPPRLPVQRPTQVCTPAPLGPVLDLLDYCGL